MPSGFAYKAVKDWTAASRAAQDLRIELARLAPAEAALLLSSGSLTVELERAAGGKVVAEIVDTGTGPAGALDAAFLDVEPSCPALKRTVWLASAGKRLVYAHTVIPLRSVDPGILDAIEREREEPLGSLLRARGVEFRKDKLEVAALECAEAALGLGLEKNACLFSRRYILTNADTGAGLIKAAVIEVFSPAIVPCKTMP